MAEKFNHYQLASRMTAMMLSSSNLVEPGWPLVCVHELGIWLCWKEEELGETPTGLFRDERCRNQRSATPRRD